jgi:hypothetical protein
MTDYTQLNGAEFQRAVGADPEKWAEAFRQRELPNIDIDTDEIAAWFRDAMEAAVKANWQAGLNEALDLTKRSEATRAWVEEHYPKPPD